MSVDQNSIIINGVSETGHELLKELKNKEEKELNINFLKQQQEYILQQQKLIEIQKEDIKENQKTRRKTENFTFILAFGVIITLIYYIYQTLLEFKKSSSLHLLIISRIFIFTFLLMAFFISKNFDIKNQIKVFWTNSSYWVKIGLPISIILLVIILNFVPDNSLEKTSPELTESNQPKQIIDAAVNSTEEDSAKSNDSSNKIMINRLNLVLEGINNSNITNNS